MRIASRLTAWALASYLAASPSNLLAVEPPTAEAQMTLRKGFKAAFEGNQALADTLLTQSIAEWTGTKQKPDEVAAIYKQRGIVRQAAGKMKEAAEDLTQALKLVEAPGATPDLVSYNASATMRPSALAGTASSWSGHCSCYMRCGAFSWSQPEVVSYNAAISACDKGKQRELAARIVALPW